MSKTLTSLAHEAETKRDLWLSTSLDKDALKDRDMHKDDALCLYNYWCGKYDAYTITIEFNLNK